MKTLQLPTVWAEAGLNVVTMAGWDTPAQSGYVWRVGDPEASMWHHTATTAFTPQRESANVWAGLQRDGRLYQSGGGVPTLVVANAYPAPISSGYGQQWVLAKARDDQRNDHAATGPDDNWAGNRSYMNTEVILDGTGGVMAPEVWSMIVTAAGVMHELFGWSEWRALGHGQHTSRKIDLRDGRWPNMVETMKAFREDMGGLMGTFEGFVAGWVRGLAEDPSKSRQEFQRLYDAGILEGAGAVDYWVGLLNDPTNAEWPGFYARTELSVWGL